MKGLLCASLCLYFYQVNTIFWRLLKQGNFSKDSILASTCRRELWQKTVRPTLPSGGGSTTSCRWSNAVFIPFAKVSSRTYLVYLYKHWSGTFAPTNVFTFNALFKETLSCTGEGARAGINTQLYTHVHAFTHVMHSCTLKYSHFRTCWTVVHFKHTHFKDVLHSCSLKCTHLRTWAKIAKAKP